MSSKTSTINVNVLQKHITNGVGSEPSSCAIAMALRSKGYKNVSVSQSGITFETAKGNERQVVKVPAVAQRFINRFDNAKRTFASPKLIQRLKPFSFTLVHKAA